MVAGPIRPGSRPALSAPRATWYDAGMWISEVRRTLELRALLPPRPRVLVALSGGPDSAGLLLALATLAPTLSLELFAATIDHGLRPSSKDDVAIATEQAKRVGVPLEVVTLALTKGPDLQARARSARYEALFEVARTLHCDRVAVGHTREDQAETVLARILRGSSLRGIRGIHAARGDGVVRPLIEVSRADVHAAVAAAQWPVALDPGNDLDDYQRVRIRKELMPRILAESPQAVSHLCDLADDAAQALELIEAMASGGTGRGALGGGAPPRRAAAPSPRCGAARGPFAGGERGDGTAARPSAGPRARAAPSRSGRGPARRRGEGPLRSSSRAPRGGRQPHPWARWQWADPLRTSRGPLASHRRRRFRAVCGAFEDRARGVKKDESSGEKRADPLMDRDRYLILPVPRPILLFPFGHRRVCGGSRSRVRLASAFLQPSATLGSKH
jgi:tRNA(Ile)-lysidine synthetase-like protein